MEFTGRIKIITGHYGSGKTNLAVNLAVDAARQGQDVTLIDLDIVNPYFRSADFTGELEKLGVRVIAPLYANSNLDIPALTGAVDAALETEKGRIIVDVGGDDAGAIALGRYAPAIRRGPYDFFYIVNQYRYLTSTPEEALRVLDDITAVSRLTPTGIVNNSNLGEETVGDTVTASVPFAQEIAQTAGLPLWATAYDQRLGALPVPEPYPVAVWVKKIWEP